MKVRCVAFQPLARDFSVSLLVKTVAQNRNVDISSYADVPQVQVITGC